MSAMDILLLAREDRERALVVALRPDNLLPDLVGTGLEFSSDCGPAVDICLCLDAVILRVGLVGRSSIEVVLSEHEVVRVSSETFMMTRSRRL